MINIDIIINIYILYIKKKISYTIHAVCTKQSQLVRRSASTTTADSYKIDVLIVSRIETESRDRRVP